MDGQRSNKSEEAALSDATLGASSMGDAPEGVIQGGVFPGAGVSGQAIYFVGIGGCGMSGLARIASRMGARCYGSDAVTSPVTDMLIQEGIDVSIIAKGQSALPEDATMLVVSAAIDADHAERIEAARRGLPVVKYAELLGRLMQGRTGVAIAGTHGKSTTTSMLAHVLIQGQIDPTFIVGASCRQLGGGCRAGRTDMLIAEACEYDRSFHNFHPTHGVILNVEEDHLDIYGSLDRLVEAFGQFAKQISPDGSLLIGHEGAHRTAVVAGVRCAVETIGFAPQADWQIVMDSERSSNGRGPTIELRHQGESCCVWTSQLAGEHMAYNSAVAAVTAHRLGVSWPMIAEALSGFEGLERRMESLGTYGGIQVVDDYGHHPTEIETTLRALREAYWQSGQRVDPVGLASDCAADDSTTSSADQYESGRLICVFQPHQHSRTRFLLDQFATSFSQADMVIVPDIYFVRDSEEDRQAVSSHDLVYRLQQQGVLALHIAEFDDIAQFLLKHCRAGDLLVVMGAGPVWQIGHQVVKQLRASSTVV